jgi:hypothetical protein
MDPELQLAIILAFSCLTLLAVVVLFFQLRRKQMIDQAVLDKSLADLTAAVDAEIAKLQAVTPDATVQTFVDGVNAQTTKLNS